MYYIIYKTTNKINGKFYIGSHKTSDLNDGYMGSGKYLNHAIKKYGVENFSKEILFVFDNPENMYAKEAEIVNEDFLSEENTYNMKVGGYGGWDYINGNTTLRIEKNKRARTSADKIIKEKYGVETAGQIPHVRKINSERMKQRHESGLVNIPSFFGKTHTDISKHKISEKAKLRIRDKNSQYGTMWITDGITSKKIKVTEPIPNGWYRGRVIKKPS